MTGARQLLISLGVLAMPLHAFAACLCCSPITVTVDLFRTAGVQAVALLATQALGTPLVVPPHLLWRLAPGLAQPAIPAAGALRLLGRQLPVSKRLLLSLLPGRSDCWADSFR